MMGIQNVAAMFCIPLIPFCWDTKYGSHILYPLKDQRGDTKYGRHTEYGVTLVSTGCWVWVPKIAGCKTLVSFGLLPVPLHFCSPADTVPLKGGPVRMVLIVAYDSW